MFLWIRRFPKVVRPVLGGFVRSCKRFRATAVGLMSPGPAVRHRCSLPGLDRCDRQSLPKRRT